MSEQIRGERSNLRGEAGHIIGEGGEGVLVVIGGEEASGYGD